MTKWLNTAEDNAFLIFLYLLSYFFTLWSTKSSKAINKFDFILPFIHRDVAEQLLYTPAFNFARICLLRLYVFYVCIFSMNWFMGFCIGGRFFFLLILCFKINFIFFNNPKPFYHFFHIAGIHPVKIQIRIHFFEISF